MDCNCWFCQSNMPHPKDHAGWHRISSHLLVAESLDPADSVPQEACLTGGHRRNIEAPDLN